MNETTVRESEYDFTLLLDGVHEITDDIERAFFEAGCDDATISVRCGRMCLNFSRTAASIKDAIISAIHDVNKANTDAVVHRVDVCDLVTQSDISRRIGRTRQLVNQYIAGTRGPGGFPPPACNLTENVPLWYWCEVAYWLWQNNIIKEDVLRDAQQVASINAVLELEYQRRLEPDVINQIIHELSLCSA